MATCRDSAHHTPLQTTNKSSQATADQPSPRGTQLRGIAHGTLSIFSPRAQQGWPRGAQQAAPPLGHILSQRPCHTSPSGARLTDMKFHTSTSPPGHHSPLGASYHGRITLQHPAAFLPPDLPGFPPPGPPKTPRITASHRNHLAQPPCPLQLPADPGLGCTDSFPLPGEMICPGRGEHELQTSAKPPLRWRPASPEIDPKTSPDTSWARAWLFARARFPSQTFNSLHFCFPFVPKSQAPLLPCEVP